MKLIFKMWNTFSNLKVLLLILVSYVDDLLKEENIAFTVILLLPAMWKV